MQFRIEAKFAAVTIILCLVFTYAFLAVIFTAVSPAQAETYYTFTGGGHGHGAGMSMAGVSRLAKAGRDYPKIIKYYYKGVGVGRRGGLPSQIRAAVHSTKGSLSFSADNHFRVYNTRNRYQRTVNKGDIFSVRFTGSRYNLRVTRRGKTIWYKTSPLSLIIKPWKATYLKLRNNNRRYKGNFYTRSTGTRAIWAINKLPLSTYLKGLGEEPESWPIKGLRTLAVASRTYAVQKIQKKSAHYDINQSQQFYVGIRKAPRMAYAVNSTRKVIITYKGKTIIAAYSANSGGYVADFRTLWGGKGYPYLRARKDTWSKGTKNYRWGPVKFSGARLQSIFKKNGVNVGTLTDLRFSKRGSDRRPKKVTIVGSGGSKTVWAHGQFSSWLGLKSSLMYVRKGDGSTLSINASTKRLRPRQPISIYGKVRPSKSGTVVIRYKKGKSKWRTAKRVKLAGDVYRTKIRLNSAARYVFSAKVGSTNSRNMVITAAGKAVKVRRAKKARKTSSAKKNKSRKSSLIRKAGSSRPTIVLDPGHGGRQAGAIGPNRLAEKTVNLRVALRLRRYLRAAGAKVVMTRTRDKTLSLAARVRIAKRAKADRFISIHHNSARNRRVNGTETYAKRGANYRSRHLARKVQNNLLRSLRLSNRGSRRANFYVLRKSSISAILTEASFISNRTQASRLRRASYIDREARAIYNGIRQHMSLKRLYSPLGIQGTSAPASEIHFPHVVDTNGKWRSFASVKNSSDASVTATIYMYSGTGALVATKDVGLGAQRTYSFYPRKIYGRNFNGSIKITTATESLVGQLSQVAKNNKAFANTQAIVGATELHIPKVVDNGPWRSFITIKNTADAVGRATINYYDMNGALVKNQTVNMGPQSKYNFYPMAKIGAKFEGSIKIEGTTALASYVSRVNKRRTRLGIAPAMQKSQDLYFAQAPENSAWRSYIAIKNSSDQAQAVSIFAYDSSGGLIVQKDISLGANASVEYRVQSILGRRFNGVIKVSAQSEVLAAYLTQADRRGRTLGLMEGQRPVSVLDFGYINDGGSTWNSEYAIGNTSTSGDFILNLYNSSGSSYSTKTQTINENGYYRVFPWTLESKRFTGSIRTEAPSAQVYGYLAQSR